MEPVETSVPERIFCGTQSAGNDYFPMEKRSRRRLGAGCRGFKSLHSDHEKTAERRFFQRNPSFRTGEIHILWVKSLRGEIPLRGERGRILFHRKAKPNDFTKGASL